MDTILEVRLPLVLGLSILLGLILLAVWVAWSLRQRTVVPVAAEPDTNTATLHPDYELILYVLSHELASPVQNVLMCLANLAPAAEADEVGRRNYHAALSETRRLSQVIREVRMLAQLESANWTREPVNVNAMIQSALIMHAEQAEAAKVSMQYQAVTGLPHVLGNREQLTCVLENLLENAIKYRRPEGEAKVAITASAGPSEVVLKVADNGIGIPMEDVPHIWEPGFRSSASLVSSRGGSGLGLSLVKRIVERHGGQVALESERHVHTTFVLRLPIGQVHEARS